MRRQQSLPPQSILIPGRGVIFRLILAGTIYLGFCAVALAQSFVELALGGESICAIDTEGVLECTVPFGSRGFPSADDDTLYQAVSSGSTHTCAITQDGEIRCWGLNFANQLDIPSVDVAFVSLAATGNHTCAIDVNTQVHCWGQSSGGQLDVPESNMGFVSVFTGDGSSCGIKESGELVCWTTNVQITNSIPDNPGYADVVLGSGGAHAQSCGLTSDGMIDCWAGNAFSVDIPSSGPYQQIESNSRWLCGLTMDGIVDCNLRTMAGVLSHDANLALFDEIASLPPLSSFEILTIQGVFTSMCGLTLDGNVVCIGDTLPANTVPGSPPGFSLEDIPVPDNLSFAVYTDSTVELFWDINTDFLAGGGNIYRDGEFLTSTLNGRSFIDQSLLADQEYVYTVALLGRTGIEGPLSAPILVSTSNRELDANFNTGSLLTHPGQPANLNLIRYNDTSLEIFWDRSPSNPRYLIYRNGEFLAFAPGPSFFDDEINPDTTYHYTIVAMLRVGRERGGEVIGVGFVNEPALNVE